ncbi:MAG: LacI family DNA-binding transcriptional regulator, partial [Streptomyces sp.]|uniref:LacI family DNA-binding transcriptional regulator n=1 Tax=Streptomyces sp. TaxID=1931 RepID=UPI003D6A083D
TRTPQPGGVGTVALLVPDITNPVFFGIIRGAERQASAAGYTLVLADTEESVELEKRHLERLAQAVDGFVLASSRLPDADVRKLSVERVCALFNREVDGVPSVVVDNDDGTRQIVEHLASLDHRSIAYLAGPRASWADARRWRTLAAAARRLGLVATRLGPFPPSVNGGAAAADAAIGHGATAVVAFNDLLAIGALRRCAERGVDIPGDISVVGYDDIFGADFCSPPLTTLAAPIEDAGRAAVSLLLERLDRRSSEAPRRHVLLPSHLQIRGSSGPARQ